MNLAAAICVFVVGTPALLLVGVVFAHARAMSKYAAERRADGWECVAFPLMLGPVMVPPSHPSHSSQKARHA